MRKHRHALSGAIYEYADDGIGPVLVSKDGSWGLFTADGVWVQGEIRWADPQMCRWIASGGASDTQALDHSENQSATLSGGST
jgi:hypothetical protein